MVAICAPLWCKNRASLRVSGASTVFCVSAQLVKQLRVASCGDTLLVRNLRVHVAEGAENSQRLPTNHEGDSNSSTLTNLLCHVRADSTGSRILWMMSVATSGCLAKTMATQSAQLAQKTGGVVRTASLRPIPLRNNDIMATSPSTTTFRMLHKHAHNPVLWPSAKVRTISCLITLNVFFARSPAQCKRRPHADWTSSTKGMRDIRTSCSAKTHVRYAWK